ncbi:MAG: hypothetical protein ABIT76_00575 [Chthoniobacterales bacterium]
MKLLIFVGLNIGGYLGWAAAEPWGLTWAFAISSIGSLIGVYAGWWLARRLGK